MYFYTTAEQEAELTADYERQVAIKQAELDAAAKQTRKIQKFTARAYICRPERIFHVVNGRVLYGGKEMIGEPVPGGGTYTFDSFFSKQIDNFCKQHTEYTVVFNPDGRYGPCTYYIGSHGSMPARLIAGNDVLEADNDDAYDLACA